MSQGRGDLGWSQPPRELGPHPPPPPPPVAAFPALDPWELPCPHFNPHAATCPAGTCARKVTVEESARGGRGEASTISN